MHASTDGKVRAADIEYKLPGESVFRMTTRPVHKLVLIIPIEEQTATVGEVEEHKQALPAKGAPTPARAVTAESAQTDPPEMEPETASREESEAKKEETPWKPFLAPLRVGEGQRSPPSSSGR